MRVLDGDAVVLDLPPVDCYPPASVHWLDMASGASLLHGGATDPRRHVTRSDQLVLLDIRYDTHNNAVYRATATNRFTLQTTSSPLYLLRVQRQYHTHLSLSSPACYIRVQLYLYCVVSEEKLPTLPLCMPPAKIVHSSQRILEWWVGEGFFSRVCSLRFF